MLRQCNALGPKTVTAAFLNTRTLFLVGQAAATTYVTSTTSCNATATLTVSKAYSPSGPTTAITATPTCTTGTPSPLSHSVAPGSPFQFTITGFDAGATCSVSEPDAPAGYTQSGCQSVALTIGTDAPCTITNTLTSGTLTVSKAYSPSGPTTAITATPTCTTGTPSPSSHSVDPSNSWQFTITGFSTGATCSVSEPDAPAGYAQTGCQSVPLTNGSDAPCTITNTTTRTFNVSKVFSDGNPAAVTVILTCDSPASVTNVNHTAHPGGAPASFTVSGFAPGATGCSATENPVPAGYTPDYTACTSVQMTLGATPVTCTITNTLRSATLTVSKTYADATTTAVTVTPNCTSGAVSPSPSLSATPGGPDAVFTITGFNSGATCSIAESGGASGYAEDGANEADTCHSGVSLVANGTPSCNIFNSPSTTTFTVSKHFVPSNGGSVTVTLTCNGGVVSGGGITANSGLASEATPATFTVTAFTSGNACTASESGAPASYVGSGCVNVLLVQGATSCTLTNTIPPTPTPTPRITPTPVPTIHHNTVTPSPTPSPTPEAFSLGDVDCDGHLTPNDMLAILAYVAGTAPSPTGNAGCTPIGGQSGAHLKGDVNCDGHVDAMDALFVLLAQAGLPLPPLPSGCPGP
jgi:hypothetical protein